MSKSVRERLNAPLINLWIDWFFGKEWIGGKGVFAHDLAVDEMLLDNFLKHVWSAGVIPNGVGINDCDGAMTADPEAVGFRPINHGLRPRKLELLKAALEVLPRLDSSLL